MYYFTFCKGEIHKISVKDGKLILYNHLEEEAENEYILSMLANSEPEEMCFKIYKAWKEKNDHEIPPFLKDLVENKRRNMWYG